MDFLEGLHQFLISNVEVAAIIGDRIYPMLLPQNPTLPAVVYTPISANYDKALQKQTGFVKQTIQFNIHDKTFGKARRVSRIIKKVLQDFSGALGGSIVQATHLISDMAFNSNTTATYSVDEYICSLEFEFQYMEEE